MCMVKGYKLVECCSGHFLVVFYFFLVIVNLNICNWLIWPILGCNDGWSMVELCRFWYSNHSRN